MSFAKIERGFFGWTPAWKLWAYGAGFVVGLSLWSIVIFYSVKRAELTDGRGAEPAREAAAAEATPPAETQPAAAATAPTNGTTRVVAILSCKMQGMDAPISVCLAGTDPSNSGSLKVTTNGQVKQYSSPEIMEAFRGNVAQIDLTAPFEILAQTSAVDGAVMRLEIQTPNGRVLYQDEAEGMGVVHAES